MTAETAIPPPESELKTPASTGDQVTRAIQDRPWRPDRIRMASPVWNVRPPMIMKTFAESLDFTGRTVHPVVTYAVSGLGDAEREYADTCPGATLGRGLAVRDEEVADSGADMGAWLVEVGLARR